MDQSGPTGREWGAITTEVEKLSHDLKNMKMVVNAMSDEIDALEISLSSTTSKNIHNYSSLHCFCKYRCFYSTGTRRMNTKP